MNWFTPWLVASVEPTSWGWAYTLGPAFGLYYAFALGCLGTSMWLGYLAYRATGEGEQTRWIAAGIAVSLVVVSATDAAALRSRVLS